MADPWSYNEQSATSSHDNEIRSWCHKVNLHLCNYICKNIYLSCSQISVGVDVKVSHGLAEILHYNYNNKKNPKGLADPPMFGPPFLAMWGILMLFDFHFLSFFMSHVVNN